MTDNTSSTSGTPIERRRNLALRRLIDEMLGQVREIHSAAPLWTPEERAQAEAQLEIIMARVRREAAGLPVEQTEHSPKPGR
ncbi:MAG: hypothetical protein M3336_11075 [Chloroflexota bacterium]|nr:hypothetical protein [Chloroflexota bacterium]